jgi:hypothetical protein
LTSINAIPEPRIQIHSTVVEDIHTHTYFKIEQADLPHLLESRDDPLLIAQLLYTAL